VAIKYKSFPGMDDLLPGEIEDWQWLEEQARIYFLSGLYDEIRTPILEPTELFKRSIGEVSDIVNKEMYTFLDRGDRSMTMRPEMTAAVARAVIQNGLIRGNNILNLFYMGPMFRAERPQAGRKRQFHQIGAEIINNEGRSADFEIIRSLFSFMKLLKIESPTIKVNDLSMMNGKEGERVRKELRDFFEGHKSALDEDSIHRLDKNVLRIFDSKVASTQAVIEKMPWNDIAPVSESFQQLCDQLNDSHIKVIPDRKLVRGLDYYTGVVFELTLDGLGAQDAVAGGGRYDGLYKELGGPAAACTGFSIGMERLLMALTEGQLLKEQVQKNALLVVPLINADEIKAYDIHSVVGEAVIKLRNFGFKAKEGRLTNKLDKHFKQAEKIGADWMLICGADEYDKKEWKIRNLKERAEISLNWNDKNLINTLMKEMRESELL
jgi:histidyl-tRNA synthetase